MNKLNLLFVFVISTSFLYGQDNDWISLFNGENLENWTIRGEAEWKVEDGKIVGSGANGHLYAMPEIVDVEIKGTFRIVDLGGGANGGLYFRCYPPEDNPDGYPQGYEAQICNHQDAFTGWLWKPGNPTGEAKELLTKDGEWFSMRVRAKGTKIKIWVNGKRVTKHKDSQYKRGLIALQCHNGGMRMEAKNIYYREL